MTGKLSLAELVTRRRAELGLSLRDVAEATGGVASYSTIHEMEAGARMRFGAAKLDAVADALGLSRSAVRQAAGRPARALAPFVLPERASGLTPKQRRLVVRLVDLLLEAGQER